MDQQYEGFLLKSLTQHIFAIPIEGTKNYKYLPQQEGQLMGSITSFPFLCLANAAMCRWALELSNFTPYRLRNQRLNGYPKAPLRVNGDDCCMKGRRFCSNNFQTLDIRSTWEKITTFGGLKSSVGKTLFSLPHKPITVINSKTFDYVDGLWVERKYINMGLLLGKKRSGIVEEGTPSKRSYAQIGSVHHDLMNSCPESLIQKINQRFIYFNSEILKQCPDIPWSTPEYLGGPGLKRLGARNELDKRVISLMIYNQKKNGTLIDKRLKCERNKTQFDWYMNSRVMERLKLIGVEKQPFLGGRVITGDIASLFPYDDSQDFSLETEYSKLYKYLTIETLFTYQVNELLNGMVSFDEHGCKDEDFFVDVDPHASQRLLNRNNNAFARARDLINDLMFSEMRAREDSEIDYEKKNRFIPSCEIK